MNRRTFVRLLGAGAAATLALPGVWVPSAAKRVAVYSMRRQSTYDARNGVRWYSVDLLGGIVNDHQAVLDVWQQAAATGADEWQAWPEAEAACLEAFRKTVGLDCELVQFDRPAGLHPGADAHMELQDG